MFHNNGAFLLKLEFYENMLTFCGYAKMLSTDWQYNKCSGTIIFVVQKLTNVLHTGYCQITELAGKQTVILVLLEKKMLTLKHPSNFLLYKGLCFFVCDFPFCSILFTVSGSASGQNSGSGPSEHPQYQEDYTK